MLSSLFLLLQSEKLTKQNTHNIRASESFHDVSPVETWSSKATGTSVAAYFVYHIRASNFFERDSNFSNLLAPWTSG